jgi:hypothetical protein
MRVDTRPFPCVNMLEGHMDSGEWSARRRLDFLFDVNMAGSPRRHDEEKGASPCDRLWNGEKNYICSRNMNTSIGSIASMNQKMKNMNTVLGRV